MYVWENSSTTHGKGFLQPPRSVVDATPEGDHGVKFNRLGATFIEKVLGFQTIASLSSSHLTYERSMLNATVF